MTASELVAALFEIPGDMELVVHSGDDDFGYLAVCEIRTRNVGNPEIVVAEICGTCDRRFEL